MKRSEWLAARRTGIGGTDAAAILGLSPWRSPMDVWLDKMGHVQHEILDPEREDLLFLGSAIEPIVAALYSRKTGRALLPIEGVLRHPKFPVILGSPDRLVVGEPRGVEIKTEHVFSDKFGDPGTDEVPEHYAAQCAVYMAITDRDAWDLALLHGGAKFSIYTLERDRATESGMIEFLVDWWNRHVVGNTPPEIDGSDGAARYLAQRFERNVLPLANAESEEERLAIELGKIRAQFQEIEDYKKILENRIKAVIGDREGIRGTFGRVTWKRTKDGIETDFEAAYQEATREIWRVFEDAPHKLREKLTRVAREVFEEALQKNTHPKLGYRRLLYTPAKS